MSYTEVLYTPSTDGSNPPHASLFYKLTSDWSYIHTKSDQGKLLVYRKDELLRPCGLATPPMPLACLLAQSTPGVSIITDAWIDRDILLVRDTRGYTTSALLAIRNVDFDFVFNKDKELYVSILQSKAREALDSDGATVAHILASNLRRIYVLDMNILSLRDNAGQSVAHIYARNGFDTNIFETYTLTDRNGQAVAHVLATQWASLKNFYDTIVVKRNLDILGLRMTSADSDLSVAHVLAHYKYKFNEESEIDKEILQWPSKLGTVQELSDRALGVKRRKTWVLEDMPEPVDWVEPKIDKAAEWADKKNEEYKKYMDRKEEEQYYDHPDDDDLPF